MKIIIKKVKCVPYEQEVNGVADIMAIVGGPSAKLGGKIRKVCLCEDAVIIYNTAAMQTNCTICGKRYCGTIVFAGLTVTGKFCSMPIKMENFKRLFSSLFIYERAEAACESICENYCKHIEKNISADELEAICNICPLSDILEIVEECEGGV